MMTLSSAVGAAEGILARVGVGSEGDSSAVVEVEGLIRMVEVPAGSFMMGSEGPEAEWDERPVHRVTISRAFRMGVTEVTNAQYELFDPGHRSLRGKDGVSTEDDDAVVNVSWFDAVEFCRWLSEREGRSYRLPTEAEWEWACRAGTDTPYFTGDTLPTSMCRNQVVTRDYAPVSLRVGVTEPNSFGLCDMHGNVEEWCMDWYGPYPGSELSAPAAACDSVGTVSGLMARIDPTGPVTGEFRVTRGGSHNTPLRYLRSSNRMAMIPEDRHSLTGFRVVQTIEPGSAAADPEVCWEHILSDSARDESERYIASADSIYAEGRGRNSSGESSCAEGRKEGVSSENGRAVEAFFAPPVPFVLDPGRGETGERADSLRRAVPFFRHNHQPSVTWCENGDLIAAWYSTDEENGREMAVLSSRLRAGRTEWEEPRLFFKVPDRNMTGTALFNDGQGTLYHINGVEAAGDWQNLILVMRTSTDNGFTWSAPRIIAPEHARRHQAVSGTLVLPGGVFVQACDAGPGGNDGTAVLISCDRGLNWVDPWDGSPLPRNDGEMGRAGFAEGSVGTTIAGIHAGIVALKGGEGLTLMAFGRGFASSVEDGEGRLRMPMSISRDMGRTWEYHASEFPPIDSGQRLVLMRLREGPLLLVSFTGHPDRTPEAESGMEFTLAGNTFSGHGMFAAVSYDEGRTWPVRRLLTDGVERELDGGGWTGTFRMDATHAEPKGYLTGTQTPDGTIHILSSRLHYQFNLSWLEQSSDPE